jgi:hypothetical protein
VIFAWLAVTGSGLVVAWHDREKRGAAFKIGIALTVVCGSLLVLAGIDNAKSHVVDCRPAFDPSSGGDVLSCRTEHWLPPSVWRVINR